MRHSRILVMRLKTSINLQQLSKEANHNPVNHRVDVGAEPAFWVFLYPRNYFESPWESFVIYTAYSGAYESPFTRLMSLDIIK